ncbi:MAG: hypothetical protein GYB66_11125 [Chloroflexi bacterium]|nr:hypothetical protein [Chloroflexota bacterium]
MRRYLTLSLRLLLLLIVLLFVLRDGAPDRSRRGVIRAQIQGHEFNYIAWELETLWQKAGQVLFGYHPYISDASGKAIVLEYIGMVGQIRDLDRQIEAIYADPGVSDPRAATRELRHQRDRLAQQQHERRLLAEPIIERQIATVLQEEGFGLNGQVLPPVSFRFVETPDVLIVSPRDNIQQDFSFSLQPVSVSERETLERAVEQASPGDAAYITGVGGVGIWPSMVVETQYPAIGFEIVAHEWAHHYLFFYPLGLEYLVRPETRIINETVATLFGNAIAIRVLERFYADEVARGEIWVPDYPTLADFQPDAGREAPAVWDDALPTSPDSIRLRQTADYLLAMGYGEAAQHALDIRLRADDQSDRFAALDPDMVAVQPGSRASEINRTRITADYLLALGYIDAAEAMMDSQRQLLGMRVLNQAWFAFNGGYQADPAQGGGVSFGPVVDVTDPDYVGDPVGPATHELLALSPNLETFLRRVRGVTQRDELIQSLIEVRAQQQTASIP